MARLFRVLCEMPVDTGLPEDVITSTLHFRHDDYAPGTTPADSANDMVDQVQEFFEAIDTPILGITAASPIVCKVYDLADAEPRVPVIVRNVVIDPSPYISHPHEVAIVLSMRAAAEAGANAKRRRGRMFLGPISTNTLVNTGGRLLITAAAMNAIVDGAVAAFRTGLTAADPYLCIYSRTNDAGGASLDESFVPVKTFHVDNAYDTVRSRGAAATTRVSNTVTDR